MKCFKSDMLPRYEYMMDNLILGASDHHNYLYDRYYVASSVPNNIYASGYRKPTLSQLNWFGRKFDGEFLHRHQLPKTLRAGSEYIASTELPKGIYFRDDTLGRFYVAETSAKMPNRALRFHYLAYRKTSLEIIEPEQRVIKSITITDQKALREYKKWHKELLEAEEAITILEPEHLRNMLSKPVMFGRDFCVMIREAYLSSAHPASVLADVSDKFYEIPMPAEIGIGTRTGYHTWLEAV